MTEASEITWFPIAMFSTFLSAPCLKPSLWTKGVQALANTIQKIQTGQKALASPRIAFIGDPKRHKTFLWGLATWSGPLGCPPITAPMASRPWPGPGQKGSHASAAPEGRSPAAVGRRWPAEARESPPLRGYGSGPPS